MQASFPCIRIHQLVRAIIFSTDVRSLHSWKIDENGSVSASRFVRFGRLRCCPTVVLTESWRECRH